MKNDQYNLNDKSDAELHAWLAQQKPGSDASPAAAAATLRRVARIEELMEQSEAPVRKREAIAVLIAILSLAAFITYTVITYQ